MELTRKADYAVRAMVYLAQQPPGEVVQTRAISQAQEIPETFLIKILQTLSKAGLVLTARGVQGGVQLALPPAQISLRRVVEAIEGPISLNRCALHPEYCGRSSHCPVHPVWAEVSALLAAKLESVTLAHIVQKGQQNHQFKSAGAL
ncbi:MAG: Rrf2 family transcriptional regulator [Bacillota bacterium]|nr:Rrf2 family transcriptional regulator [Bacillota bacterium]